MNTTTLAGRDATVVRAVVHIIAVQQVLTGNANPAPAVITDAADVAVVARDIEELMNTAEIGVTRILSTRILVPASNRAADTLTVHTKVIFRAEVIIVAHTFNGLMLTYTGFADVGGTRIVIVTVHE